jgi:hypothetical protein
MKPVFKKIVWSTLLTLLIFQVQCAQPPAPQQDCGFVQNSDGQRVSWKGNLPIKIWFDASFPTQYYQSVQNAINTWEQGVGRKVFDLQGPLPPSTPTQDGMSVIYWMGSWDPKLPNQQANTTIYWVDNRITEADMRINAQNFSFSASSVPNITNVDIESLVLHELGHSLGLKHDDLQPSVMATFLQSGYLRRTLYPADNASIKCEY